MLQQNLNDQKPILDHLQVETTSTKPMSFSYKTIVSLHFSFRYAAFPLLELSAVRVEQSIASVQSTCNAVELEECLRELAGRVDLEEMETLDLVLSAAEAQLIPLPCDGIACDVDSDGGDHDWRVGLRTLNEGLLRWDGHGAELDRAVSLKLL